MGIFDLPTPSAAKLGAAYAAKGNVRRTYDVTAYGVTAGADSLAAANTAAIDALSTQVSAAGGGVLYYPAAAAPYPFSRSIRMLSYVHHVGDGARSVIRNPWTASAIFERAAFMPGYVHGAGIYQSNPAGKRFPVYAVADVAVGAVTVAGSSAGAIAASGIAVGDAVGLRSGESYVQDGNTEVPSLLHWTKVRAISGDTITLMDPSPFAFSTASVLHITPGITSLDGIPYWMPSDISVRNLGFDARGGMFQGGGCFGLLAENLVNVSTTQTPSCILSLNAIVRGVFENIDSDFYYTQVEVKLGSAEVLMRRLRSTHRAGSALFAPVGIGEGSRRVIYEESDLSVGSDFDGSTLNIVDISHCDDVRVQRNRIRALPTAANNLLNISGASVLNRSSRNVRVEHNDFETSATVLRGVTMGIGAAVGPRFVRVCDNSFGGVFAVATNEWLRIDSAHSYLVTGNLYPSETGFGVVTTGRGEISGNYPHMTANSSYMGRVETASGWVSRGTSTRNLTRIPFRGAVRSVRVEVTTAFNATTPTLKIGHAADDDAYVTTVDLSTTGVTVITPGAAGAGVALGKRDATAYRDVLAVASWASGTPTTGAALLTVDYDNFLPPPPAT